MNTSERLIPLAENDRETLLARKSKLSVYAFLMALFAVLILVPLLFVRNLILFIALIAPSLFLVLAVVGAFLQITKLKKDLAQGQKRIISGTIEAQNIDVVRQKDSDGVEQSATYTFWVKVQGKKLTVTEDQYYQLKKGDQIEAEMAPFSEILFRINKFAEI
jgi:hypothetical protein